MNRLLPLLLPVVGLTAVAAPLTPDRPNEVLPERVFDMTRLTLDLKIHPESRSVNGTASWTGRRLRGGSLVLDQAALDVSAVTSGGEAVPWRLDGDTLVIDAPGVRGDEVTVAVAYAATPRTGLHFRAPGKGSPDTYAEVYSQGEGEDNRHWFPGWDHPADRFAYEGHFTAPAGWQVVTNSGDDLVNYLVMLAAGEYEVRGQAPFTALVPPGTPAEALTPVLDPIPEMMAFFGERTGVPYAWGDYRQIFVQRFLYSGMENTGATIMARELLAPSSSELTRRWTEAVVAHELAHQWYGDLLTCHTWRELWLNEGFATFMAGQWAERQQGADAYAAQVRGWMSASLSGPPLARRFHQGQDGPDSGHVYVKGASVLQMLRVHLGEDVFWEGIRRYTQDHAHQTVESSDLRRTLEAVSGRDLGWFFQQWVELPATPELTVSGRYANEAYTISVRQETGDERPVYAIPFSVELGVAEGVVRREAWLTDAAVEIVVPMASAPLWLAFDPDGGVLATVDVEQDPAAWEAQLASPSAFARIDAIRALGETDRSEALAALLADAAQPEALREAAADALGEQRATAALLAGLGDPASAVRGSVVQGLGMGVGTEAVAALRERVRRDADPVVRGAALEALAHLDEGAALAEARTAALVLGLALIPLRKAAARVLGEHGDAADLGLLLGLGDAEHRGFEGLWGAVRLAARQEPGKARDRAMERVARAAEAMLADPSQRARESAVAALGEVGDDRSVAALEAFRRSETIADLAEAARGSVKAIRARAAAAPERPNETGARLEALEDRLEDMSAELERLRDRH